MVASANLPLVSLNISNVLIPKSRHGNTQGSNALHFSVITTTNQVVICKVGYDPRIYDVATLIIDRLLPIDVGCFDKGCEDMSHLAPTD